MNTKIRKRLKLQANNDNKEQLVYAEVCTSCYCKPRWTLCDAAGVCSHGKESDAVFNALAYRAFSDFKSGRIKLLSEAAKANGISVHDFYRYRKARGLIN